MLGDRGWRRSAPPAAPVTDERARHVPTRKRVGTAASALLLLGLAFLLWPLSLGGRTGFTVVSGHSMEPTFHTGDVVVTRSDLAPEVGDVVVYTVPRGRTGEGAHVIHRIVGGGPTSGYVTQGDNNPAIDPWHPQAGDVVGRVVVVIPQGATHLQAARTPLVLGVAAALVFLWVVWSPVTTAGPLVAAPPRRTDPCGAGPASPPRRGLLPLGLSSRDVVRIGIATAAAMAERGRAPRARHRLLPPTRGNRR
jgi:signal peptidase I